MRRVDRRHACDRCGHKPVVSQQRIPGRRGYWLLLCAECEDRRKMAVARTMLEFFGIPQADEWMQAYADELAGRN